MRTCVCLFIFVCVFFYRTSGSKYICDCVYVVQVERGIGLWCYCHFQQYFSYIMAVSFIAGENHRPTLSHCQIYHIMLHRVHMTMSRIRTYNFSPIERKFWRYRRDHQKLQFEEALTIQWLKMKTMVDKLLPRKEKWLLWIWKGR